AGRRRRKTRRQPRLLVLAAGAAVGEADPGDGQHAVGGRLDRARYPGAAWLNVAVRIGVRHGQEGVVGLGVADADPGAVTGERADGDALVEAGRGEVQGVLAQAHPDEV